MGAMAGLHNREKHYQVVEVVIVIQMVVETMGSLCRLIQRLLGFVVN